MNAFGALAISLRIVFPALVFVVPVGAWIGFFLARRRGVFRGVVDAMVIVPLVLPPSVVGYALLIIFGRRGFVGAFLENVFGARLVFSSVGASIAAAAVALPLMAKGAEAAFSRVDRALEEVAIVNGLNARTTFRVVTLPLALPGLVVATTLAALRALGEFGATLTFAGYSKDTATAPLEIYFSIQQGQDARALTLSIALVVISILAAILLRVWSRS